MQNNKNDWAKAKFLNKKNGGSSYCFKGSSYLFLLIIIGAGIGYCKYDLIGWVIKKSAVKYVGCKSV
ncbi:hypothetical protein DMA11_04400 [Marinilabiliaceae bacterium JC017]|nr:hypothetical protein DMA11_04400 [Marinilabiliaceae bacterium JC017]